MVHLDYRDVRPIYAQIIDSFKEQITAGILHTGEKLPSVREIAYGAAIGVPNFFSSQFMLQALATVPGVIAYPVYSVAGILLVTLAGVVFFRERLQKRQWTALGIILIALILLNL